MAPKSAKKGGSAKKKKAPAIQTSDEALAPFGFKVNDIIRTPLGILGTVLGVKYTNPEVPETGRIWVGYANGQEAPLEPTQGAGNMGALGYRRCPEADHIRRQVDQYLLEVAAQDEQRRKVEEVLRYKEQGKEIPEELLPKAKPIKADKDAKKKK